MSKIKIELYGPFRVLSSEGADITPKSLKAQAIIAILGTTDTFTRKRSWLRQTLWSDRSRDQGSASLRQALTALRRCFASVPEAILTSRSEIWLNPAHIEIAPKPPDSSPPLEFLEGNDVSDPVFRRWLQEMRGDTANSSQSNSMPPTGNGVVPKWTVRLENLDARSLACHPIVAEFHDLLGQNIAELSDLVLLKGSQSEGSRPNFRIAIAASNGPDESLVLETEVIEPETGRQIWHHHQDCGTQIQSLVSNVKLLGVIYRMLSIVSKALVNKTGLESSISQPQRLLIDALPKIFSFDRRLMDQATSVLHNSLDWRTAGSFFGWQAQISVINVAERLSDAPEACIERGKHFATKAIESDPMSSMALSTAANAHVLLNRDIATGGELARLAIRINPANPMGWWAYSNAKLYSQDPSSALDSARLAQKISLNTPLQFWCDFQVGLALLCLGRLDEAARCFERSSALSPNFRPPRRYLLAILAQQGNAERARQICDQLRGLELDFSLEAFSQDMTYPISFARNSDILDLTKVQDLF